MALAQEDSPSLVTIRTLHYLCFRVLHIDAHCAI